MAEERKSLRQSFVSVCGSWKFLLSGVIAVVVAAIIFGFFSEAIGNAWPLGPWPTDGRTTIWIAVAFWFFLIIGVVLCSLYLCGRLLKENLKEGPQLICGGVLAVAGLTCLFLAPDVSHYAGTHPSFGAFRSLYSLACFALAITVLILADIYILRLIWAAAWASSNHGNEERWPGIPELVPALGIVALLFLSLVFSFGRLYIASHQVCRGTVPLESRSDALYYSLVTITTLGYGDYAPNDSTARWIVIFELASGLLFLIMAFPILASRLADLGAGKVIIQKTKDGLEVTGIQDAPQTFSTSVTISYSGNARISDHK